MYFVGSLIVAVLAIVVVVVEVEVAFFRTWGQMQ